MPAGASTAATNKTLVAGGRSLLVEQGAPVPDYDAIVAAMSRAVGQLGSEIAAAIATKAPATARKPRPGSVRLNSEDGPDAWCGGRPAIGMKRTGRHVLGLSSNGP